jgi:hypothetical protein
MSKKEPKKKLVGPWRSIHAVIWLVGLYILFTRNWLIPGIFVLFAISAIYEGLLRKYAPYAFVEEGSDQPAVQSQNTDPADNPATPVAATSAPSTPEHRYDLLPYACPNCNGPIRSHEVKWTGPHSANCPYCGTNLPMSKA